MTFSAAFGLPGAPVGEKRPLRYSPYMDSSLDLTCDQLIDQGTMACPRLLGDAKTPALMYLAARPGARRNDLIRFLGRSNGTVDGLVRDLKDRGLIVSHRRRYWLNGSLSRSRELEQLLRALALGFGVRPDPKILTLRKRRSVVSASINDLTLRSLFQTELRTTLLLMIVGLGEMYSREVSGLVSNMMADVCAALRSFESQGLLISRRCRQMRLYRLNPSFAAADELRALLAALAMDRPDIIQSINAVLILRRSRHFRSSITLAPFFEVVMKEHAPAKSLNGTHRRVEGFIGMGQHPPRRYTGLGGPRLSKKNRLLLQAWKRKRLTKRLEAHHNAF